MIINLNSLIEILQFLLLNKFNLRYTFSTLLRMKNKSTDDNENPSFVCERPIMVMVFFTFKK